VKPSYQTVLGVLWHFDTFMNSTLEFGLVDVEAVYSPQKSHPVLLEKMDLDSN